MANRPAIVSKADVTRTVKGVVAAGVPVGRIEVDLRTGRVVIFPEGSQVQSVKNSFDEVLDQ